MAQIIHNLAVNYYETAAMLIFGIGFSSLLLNRNMIKKIIGLNFMDTGIFLFLTAKGYIAGRVAPIVTGNGDKFINPLPAGLVLTGIVVSVSVTAIMLSLTIRMYKRYGSLNIDEITRRMKLEIMHLEER